MKLKRIISVMLAAFLILTMLPMSASAAKKGIKLSKTTLSLAVNDTATLTRTVTGYKKYTVQWSSSDKTVATVSKGKVTAKKEGTATITARIKGTEYKATCKVTVTKKSSGKTSSESKSSSKTKTAEQIVADMTIGWNLGNTLDSIGCSWIKDESQYETGWGNPKTTKAMITAVKKAGFNAIRIPVSWGEHMDEIGNINKAWLDRVQEVVDYAYDNDMYVILNSHHDNSWIKLDAESEKDVTQKYKNLWKQIAERFKDYDEKLLFEGLNEPRTEGSAKEWSGGTSSEHKVLNNLYKAFVSAVRDTGGNNKTRILIVAPYAASSSYTAMAALEVPDDDRVIVSIHAYIPYNAAFNRDSNEKTLSAGGKGEIDTLFKNIDKLYLSKGIPAIIGEFGSVNKSNTKDRAEIAKYYVSTAKKYGVPCFWWDNGSNCEPSQGEGFGLLNRSTLEWLYPDIVKALVNAAK